MTVRVITAPRVTIRTFGGEEAETIHRGFTRRHPRFPITGAKRWGVALVRLPDTFDAYLHGCSDLVRRKRRRALARGYRFDMVRPLDFLDDIMLINESAPERQGRPMSAWYMDRERVAETHRDNQPICGVLDTQGRLRAYAVVPTFGDASVLSVLLGHADDLDAGVMYLLITEAIRLKIDERAATGSPLWMMYDTFWGARPGLAYFKERFGFAPFTVTWTWSGPP
jgi:hypothetical protein